MVQQFEPIAEWIIDVDVRIAFQRLAFQRSLKSTKNKLFKRHAASSGRHWCGFSAVAASDKCILCTLPARAAQVCRIFSEDGLAQEIAFVKHYLAIQRARFEERLAATVQADGDVLQALVPTFILQPLVENAVLYGMSNPVRKGTVEVRAWRDDGKLRIMIQDDGPGLPQDWDPDESVGIGISNTRERLRQLYGDANQKFEISNKPGKGVRVELSMPLHER